ncbi:5-dehydro-2-deoxygluconokinase [Nocardiopsis coralliicola]
MLAFGRIGVDIYPDQVGVGLDRAESFGKYLGGTATNVAVAAARHGRAAAVVSRTGDDPFADFVHTALRGFGVDDTYVTPVPGLPTPVTFCALFPPDHFPLYFYGRDPSPDLQITADSLDHTAIGTARILWTTGTGFSAEPSRTATLEALRIRAALRLGGSAGAGDGPRTVLDLDYRPQFWASRSTARDTLAEVLPLVDTAIGNLDEWETVLGVRDPDAVLRAAAGLGLGLAVVKLGPGGVLAAWPGGTAALPRFPVDTVNGLGAGDAFGGALCHGLLAGRPVAEALRFANAAGALVAGRIACSAAMPTTGEVEDALARGGAPAPPTGGQAAAGSDTGPLRGAP